MMAAQDENGESAPERDAGHRKVIDGLNAEIERKTKEVNIIRQISSEINPNASKTLGVVNVLRFANTPFGVGCRDCRCEPSIKTKPHCQ
jgi:hypothetical protein